MDKPYILTAEVLEVRTPQKICNFPQKDCLRTRKLSFSVPESQQFCNVLQIKVKKCAYDYMLCMTFLHSLVFEVASSPLFLTYCKIDFFRVLRQSFCGKLQIFCRVWTPGTLAFRMYDSNVSFIERFFKIIEMLMLILMLGLNYASGSLLQL